MSRTLAGFAILLTAIAVPPVSLHAQEPGKPELTKSGSGTLLLSGVKTNSGSAAISGGTSTLTISGPATLLLSAVNTSSGSAVSGGTPALNIASGTVLSSGVTTISGVTTTNGGVLEVNNAVGGVDACYATTLSFCQGGFGFTGGGIGFINGCDAAEDAADADSRRPGFLHHYGRSGHGRQRAERALHRQGNGARRGRPRQRHLPGLRHEDMDRPAVARQPR